MTRFAVAIGLLMSTAAPCFAENPQALSARLCIVTAAGQLPPVPGLVIKGSRLRDLPEELRRKGGTSAVLVELDVSAATVDVTYSFVCAFAPGKPVMVSAVGPS